MKLWHGILICGVLIALFVTMIMPYAASPELFSLENSSVSAYHKNPLVLKQVSRESSSELLLLMQEQLEGTGTIVLNVRFRNFDEAVREFEEYSAYVKNIDRIVVNLDMTESEIGEFRKEAQKNLESLTALINDTERFDAIQELIVQYQDEDDPESLTAVIFEGEVLRRKIRENYFAYENRSEPHAEKAEEFELNASSYRESVDQFRLLAEEIDAIQVERSAAAPPVMVPESYDLDIYVTPAIARYGDRVTIGGQLDGPDPARRIIAVYMDNQRSFETSTNEGGTYSYSFIVRTLPEGVHLMHATMETWHSDVASFRVADSPTTIALDANISPEGDVLVNSTLLAGTIPVIGAPVRIYADDELMATLKTGSDGVSRGSLTILPGRHQVQAVFSAPPEFPLDDSVSEVVLVVVPGTSDILLPALVVGSCVFGSFLGALYYLRRQHRIIQPDMIMAAEDAREKELVETGIPGAGTATASDLEKRYRLLVSEGRQREAAAILYKAMNAHIARLLIKPPPRSFTAREVALSLKDLPAGESVRLFVNHYEPVRYGGREPSPARCEELLESWKGCLDAIGGGDKP
jgi:hypothetical protein